MYVTVCMYVIHICVCHVCMYCVNVISMYVFKSIYVCTSMFVCNTYICVCNEYVICDFSRIFGVHVFVLEYLYIMCVSMYDVSMCVHIECLYIVYV